MRAHRHLSLRSIPTLVVAVAASLVVMLLAPAAFAQRVGLVNTYAGPGFDLIEVEIFAGLEASGVFDVVDLVDIRSAPASAVEFAQYDALLVIGDGSGVDMTAFGDALADYVDSGGGVVTTLLATSSMSGRFVADGYQLLALDFAFASVPPLDLVPLVPDHPTLAGVTTVRDSLGVNGSFSVSPNASVVAEWSLGAPLVAVGEIGIARRVDLGMIPGSTLATGSLDPAGDHPRLIQNAVAWAARSRPNLLVNGDFEISFSTPFAGVVTPTTYGDWKGDLVTVVGPENGITPFQGDQMLRFDGTLQSGASNTISSQLYQKVPVEGLAEGATAIAELWVNRVAGDANSDTGFRVRLRAHEGDPAGWSGTFVGDYNAVPPDIGQSAVFETDSDPTTWERIELRLELPQALVGPPFLGDSFVSLEIQANENVSNDPSLPEFDGHYADAASLRIVSPEVRGAGSFFDEPTVEIVWTASDGIGTPGGPAIEAAPGDTLTATVYLSTTIEGVSAYNLSLRFDTDLGDELDLLAVAPIISAWTTAVGGNPASTSESSTSSGGEIAALSASADPFPGPRRGTFPIARVTFQATANVTSDGPDVLSNLSSGTSSAALSNAGSPLEVVFGNASVNAPIAAGTPVTQTHEVLAVRSPDNPADTNGFGSVPYSYWLGRTEVSVDQYIDFLNAVDANGTNALGLYDPAMTSGTYGHVVFSTEKAPGLRYFPDTPTSGNLPINYVDWRSAARYVNWLENGRPTDGSGTESGTYDMSQASPVRNPNADWALPGYDEWYKAAFYAFGTSYYNYPRSNSVPSIAFCDSTGNVTNPGSNVANFGEGCFWNPSDFFPNLVWVGASQSLSSRFADLAGNVYEWLEAPGPAGGAIERVVVGGSFGTDATPFTSEFAPRTNAAAGGHFATVGFRVMRTPNRDTDEDGVPDDGFSDGNIDLLPADSDSSSGPWMRAIWHVQNTHCAPGQTLGCDDNCPYVPNPDQTDFDGDGFGDVCDVCPQVHDVGQLDTDGDGVGDFCDPDADGDGIPNASDPDDDDDGLLDVQPPLETCDTGDFEDCVDNCRVVPTGIPPGLSVHGTPQIDCDGDGFGMHCDCNDWSDSGEDSDGDGIPDGCDACPFYQDAHNVDSDGDGAGNVCDNCPAFAHPSQADLDGDGIGDPCDNCPAIANAAQTDGDFDGVGDACDGVVDFDGDGISDLSDNCPLVSNVNQADGDGDTYGDACDPLPQAAPMGSIPTDLELELGCDFDSSVVDFSFVFSGTAELGRCEYNGSLSETGSFDVLDITYIGDSPVVADCCTFRLRDAGESFPATMVIFEFGGATLAPYTDSDFPGDTIIDHCDNCPGVGNPYQFDSDGDGVGDACDNCVDFFNPDQQDSNGDGVGDGCTAQAPEPGPLGLWLGGITTLVWLARRGRRRAA